MPGGKSVVTYHPGLEGLRGLCLLGVLFFHAPFDWMGGGFLGVSTFFSLSGYLITSLLLAEWARTDGIDFAAFWRRRLRRLLPALWLAVAATLATAPWWISEWSRERLGWDGLSSLLFVSNWRFMSPDYAYSMIFDDASALQHTWSLGIEAQYYLLFPFFVAVVLNRGGTGLLAVSVAALALLSTIVCWLSGAGAEATYRAYYGSDARAAEILAGALLALVQARRGRGIVAGWRATLSGAVGLLLVLASWVVVDLQATWLYRGGFAVYALLSVAVIAAVTAPDLLLSRLLSIGPLRWLGRISYGAYVYHWPLFLFLDEERLGLSLPIVFFLRCAVTLGLADLSYRWIEAPVRYGAAAWLSWRRVALVGMATVLLALAGDPAVHDAVRQWRQSPSAGLAGDSGEATAVFAMFGDSSAVTLLPAVRRWLDRTGAGTVDGNLDNGCSIVDRGMRLARPGWSRVPDQCRHWRQRWRSTLESSPAQIAVVLAGVWDVVDRRLPGENTVRTFGDPIFDDLFRRQVEEAVSIFDDLGTRVVWLTCPRLRFAPGEEPFDHVAASDARRVETMNAILREVAAARPEAMRIVDLAAHMESLPGGVFDERIRHDGVHYTRQGRIELAEWLGPELLKIAGQVVEGVSVKAAAEAR